MAGIAPHESSGVNSREQSHSNAPGHSLVGHHVYISSPHSPIVQSAAHSESVTDDHIDND